MVGLDWFDLMWFVADRQGAQLRRYTGGVCVGELGGLSDVIEMIN